MLRQTKKISYQDIVLHFIQLFACLAVKYNIASHTKCVTTQGCGIWLASFRVMLDPQTLCECGQWSSPGPCNSPWPWGSRHLAQSPPWLYSRARSSQHLRIKSNREADFHLLAASAPGDPHWRDMIRRVFRSSDLSCPIWGKYPGVGRGGVYEKETFLL